MLAILLLSLQLVRADPFWIISHAHLVSTRMDPVVNPGGVSNHVHEIVGGSAFSPNYDYAVSQSAKCTTANIAVDKSNYWVPQLYRKTASGLQLMPNSYTSTQPNEVVYEFPPGFRMLAGDMDRVTYDGNDRAQAAIGYVCLNFKGDGGPDTNNFPTRSCPDGLRAQAYFPSCWDGVNLWLEGSKHVSYPAEGNFDGSGKCPSTHPKRLVSLFYEFHFKDDFAYEPNARVWAHGDQTGYGLHADFTNGWPEGQFQKILDQGEACNVGFKVENCPALAPFQQKGGDCTFEGMTVAELPGNNPIYGSEGPNRPSYTETAQFKADGGASSDGSLQPKPITISHIKATAVRQMTVKGDPGYPANNKLITLAVSDSNTLIAPAAPSVAGPGSPASQAASSAAASASSAGGSISSSAAGTAPVTSKPTTHAACKRSRRRKH